MDAKQQNIDIKKGFSKKIGRTNYCVQFAFKIGATESIRDKTKKLIKEEVIGKKYKKI